MGARAGKGDVVFCAQTTMATVAVGHLGRHLRVDQRLLATCTMPRTLEEGWPRSLFGLSSFTRLNVSALATVPTWSTLLATINDCEANDELKEEWIATGFRELFGVEVEFVDTAAE